MTRALAARMRCLATAAVLLTLAACGSAEPTPGAGAVDAGADAPADHDAAPSDADPADGPPVDTGADACPEAAPATEPPPTPPPGCCTLALCAAVGAVCDTETCHCEFVPCDNPGQPCPDGALPGAAAECAAWPGGNFCAIVVASGGDCPPAIPWSRAGTAGIVCGGGCRVFLDDCAEGTVCSDPSGTGLGQCVRPPPRTAPEYYPCLWGTLPCEPGFVCEPYPNYGNRCARLDCGLAPGAPDCPPGAFCDARAPYMRGTCRTACNPYAEDEACGDTEICAAGVAGLDACWEQALGPLPAPGEPCPDLQCAQGATCRDGRCVERCDPAALVPASGACPADSDCLQDWYPPVCAPRCDVWSSPPGVDCAEGWYCAPAGDPCARDVGHCVPAPPDLPGEGDTCWGPCQSGFLCSQSGADRTCRALCDPAAAATGACDEDEACVEAEPTPYRGAGYGVCRQPCTAGDDDCALNEWCEPRELDPSTGRWAGWCARQ